MVAAFLLLMLGVSVQRTHVAFAREVEDGTVNIRLAIPSSLPDWQVRDLPLGPTEPEVTRVSKSLNFNSYVYRQYTRGIASFDIYAAYWRPGRMPLNSVAEHTPDGCWVQNGWKEEWSLHNVPLCAGENTLAGGESRIFSDAAGHRKHVQFWHYVGGIRYFDHGSRYDGLAGIWRWWLAVARQRYTPPLEQLFIRVSSDSPIEQLIGDPGFQEVVRNLSDLRDLGRTAVPP